MKLGKVSDADKGMNQLHFGNDPTDTRIGISPEIRIYILDYFYLRYLKFKRSVGISIVITQLMFVFSVV